MAEAERWKKWQAILAEKKKYISKSTRRAKVELRAALDAAGQVSDSLLTLLQPAAVVLSLKRPGIASGLLLWAWDI